MSFEVFTLITYTLLRSVNSLGDYIRCAAFCPSHHCMFQLAVFNDFECSSELIDRHKTDYSNLMKF